MLMAPTPHQGASFDPLGLSPHNPTPGAGVGGHSAPSPHQFPSAPYPRNCLLAPHLTGQALTKLPLPLIGEDTSRRSHAPRCLCPTVLAAGRCPAGCPPWGWPHSPCLVLAPKGKQASPCSVHTQAGGGVRVLDPLLPKGDLCAGAFSCWDGQCSNVIREGEAMLLGVWLQAPSLLSPSRCPSPCVTSQ